MLKSPIEILKDVFGFSSFRKGQDALIEHILKGRDVLGIMPTGAGKSLCYQIPALSLGGVSVVVSPLISLMKDQVDALCQNGVTAASLNSSMDWDETKEILDSVRRGRVALLYVAPERFENGAFREFFVTLGVGLFVIDEAHCVSQWGHDFRPSYMNLAAAISLLPKRPVVAAFTATATPEVRDDIVQKLRLNNPFVITTGFDRENLFFYVERPGDKLEFLLNYVRKFNGASGIVYCSTRKAVESVHDFLRTKGVSSTRYHAGLDDGERHRNQESFIYDRTPIMVATNAFGMGIDKSNVRYVLHYNMPSSIDAYYQEAGRAGRDGLPSECALLFASKDIVTARYLIAQSDNEESKQSGYRKLQAIIDYCNTGNCLRASILEYFGEANSPKSCAACGNCVSASERVDVTTEAKKILSCVYRIKERTGRNFGGALLIDVLHGSRKEQIKTLGLDTISTYALMKEYNRDGIREIVSFLTADGYIEVSDGDYPVLSLTDSALAFLRGQEKLLMRKIEQKAVTQRESAGSKMRVSVNPELFERLRELRREIAAAQNVPPYVVFADAALNGMCATLPKDSGEFLQVPGVGQVKLEKYGPRFLQAIREWLLEHKDATPETKRVAPLSETERISYEMASQGKSAKEIADIRKFTVGTVEGHVFKAFLGGHFVAESFFVTPEEEELILGVARELNTDYLSLIKEKLPPDISYNAIRFVRHKHKL